jgi:hypothetical protein
MQFLKSDFLQGGKAREFLRSENSPMARTSLIALQTFALRSSSCRLDIYIKPRAAHADVPASCSPSRKIACRTPCIGTVARALVALASFPAGRSAPNAVCCRTRRSDKRGLDSVCWLPSNSPFRISSISELMR